MEKLLRKIVDQLHDDGKAFAALDKDSCCRLPGLGRFTVPIEVIDEHRKDLIIEIDRLLRYCNYRQKEHTDGKTKG